MHGPRDAQRRLCLRDAGALGQVTAAQVRHGRRSGRDGPGDQEFPAFRGRCGGVAAGAGRFGDARRGPGRRRRSPGIRGDGGLSAAPGQLGALGGLTGGRGHPDQQRKGDGRGGPAGQRGQRVDGPAVGRSSAAAIPIAVKPTRPSSPYQSLRTASAPTIAANTASTARIPVTRTTLSLAPKAEIAKSFTGGGVRSIEASPTATTGELSGATTPATSWPTPTATAAASSPAIIPQPDRVRSISGVTLFIRRGAPGGLDSSPARYTGTCGAAMARPRTRAKPTAGRLRI